MHSDKHPWRAALWHAAPITLAILGLFYYWYAVADRYIVFLYGHDMGPLVSDTGAFSPVTRGRYWMAGLVAAGAVLVAYTLANALLGRLAARRDPPPWWRVWLLAALPLSVGIPAITMTTNAPTLPLADALAALAATLAGLALALMPGAWAAAKLADLAWLALDGAALIPALTLLRALELPGRGLRGVTVFTAGLAAVLSVVAGIVWLGIMTGLRAWRRRPHPGTGPIFLAGLALSYLCLPLVHYVVATPPAYKYISTADNFFALNPAVQLLALLVAAALAAGATWLRQQGGAGFPTPR